VSAAVAGAVQTGLHDMRNALSIDVEDYFQVSAFAGQIARADWPSMPCRVEANVDRILALLAEAGVHATFFTLGWIAERYPAMVRRIVGAGHEQSRAEFRHDISLSKALLEQLGGQAVHGYRAPSFSIGPGNLWALDALQQAGYRYSSSIYPIRHDHYGMPQAPRHAWYPHGTGSLLELPISTVRLMGHNFPAGGGGYFRLFPYALSRWALRRINTRERQAGIFYFHPWEIDPDQPRIAGVNARTRFRHYLNLHRTEARIVRLTRDFRWGRIDHIFLGDHDGTVPAI
jgi:polysaccharide deacetylase family protein (PEP-CTERM system associated)